MRDTRRPFVFGAVVAGAALVALGPIADGDIYWHLAAGDEILRRGALLRTDPFTVSAAGRAWVDVHWLFQVAVALIHRAFGFGGLSVAKAVLVAAGAAIATRTAERAAGPAARDLCAAVLLGLLFLARHLLPLRPIVATLFFLATFLAVLERHRVDTSAPARRALFVLPALRAIWVNCQGLAPLGPALIGAYFLGNIISAAGPGAPSPARRLLSPLGLAFVGCLLASFATPYGLDAVRLPARLLARIAPAAGNVFSTAIAENVPPFVLERTSPEMASHLRWVLALMGAAMLLVRPRLVAAHAFVLCGFTALALMANRNVILLYWVLAPIGAIGLAPEAARRWSATRAAAWLARSTPNGAGPAVVGAVLAAVLASELGLAGVALAREAPIGAPTAFHFPTESARRLAAIGARGPVFAPDQHGGFLAFEVPGLRPYIDTRLVLHSAREYEDYLALFDEPARFDALDARERFPYVVLTTAYPDRYLGLVAHLVGSPGWKVLYTDGSEILFGRDGAGIDLGDRATVDATAEALDARFASHPETRSAARLNLARLLIAVGHPGTAQRVLAPLTSRAAAELRARGHFAAGELGAAESLARVLLLGDPDDVRSLTLLAEIAFARRAPAEAHLYLARVLSAHPYDPEARAVLARIEHGPSKPPDSHVD